MTAVIKGPLELWGGLECSIVRVGEEYRDQFADTGHYERLKDLEAVAGLGIRTMRYPVLWEAVSPDTTDAANFAWHDRQMKRLKDLGIEPIVGLLHHGSGPRYTNLLDRTFPDLFARHALRVAERYPYVRYFTPVNEPLTTARFSALYGVWYPHRADMHAFARAVINQCRATVLAMRAIRTVNPGAKLVQTEDMGKTFSTALLKYQADYENERRWLTFDLLFGRVTDDHPWYRILMDHGIGDDELHELSGHAAPPDVVGINYYLTSERFLEHRECNWSNDRPVGGNGRHRYADLEAIRAYPPITDTGIGARLKEVWERYRTTIAVTEAHLGCSREEQLRWLAEIWRTARHLRENHIDLKAVTIWSMFGSVDWNSLLQRRTGYYEPGAFDVSNGNPRATALAVAARAISRSGDFEHPVLDEQGWWRRPNRYYRPPAQEAKTARGARKLLIVSSSCGSHDALHSVLQARGLAYATIIAAEPSIQDRAFFQKLIKKRPAWALICVMPLHMECPAAVMREVASEVGLPLLFFRSQGLLNRPKRLQRQGSQFHSFTVFPSATMVGATAGSVAQHAPAPPPEFSCSSPTVCLEDLFHLGLDLLVDSTGSHFGRARARSCKSKATALSIGTQ